MADHVRCSKCKTPFPNPMRHTGVCEKCMGVGERYTPAKRKSS